MDLERLSKDLGVGKTVGELAGDIPDSDLIRQAAADHVAETIQKNKENESDKWRNSDKKAPKEEEKEYDDNYHTDEWIGNNFEKDSNYDPDTAGNMYRVSKAIASKSEPEEEKVEEKEEEKIIKQKECKEEDERKMKKEDKKIRKEGNDRRTEEEIKMREEDGQRWKEEHKEGKRKKEKMICQEEKERKKIEEEKRKGEEGRNHIDRIKINDTAVSPAAENEMPMSSDCSQQGERERDLIPADLYLSQSERDFIPAWERRDDISSVRIENGSQPSRDVSPASDRQSSSIDGCNPQTLRDASPQQRQRDITPLRDTHKSQTSRHSGQQSRGDKTAKKNTHRQEREINIASPRDKKCGAKRRDDSPSRDGNFSQMDTSPRRRRIASPRDKKCGAKRRDDSPSRDGNFSQMDTSPRRRRRSPEKSHSPPRGKLRDHLQHQGRTRGPPRERYDRHPKPPRNKDEYVWEPNPTPERVRYDRDLHEYDRKPNPYRERDACERDFPPRGRDRHGMDPKPPRERGRYDGDHYPLRERCGKYEVKSKIPHERYGRPTPKDASPPRREHRYDFGWVVKSQIQRYSDTPPQRNSYYGQMSRESGYHHLSPRRTLYGYGQYDSDESRRRFDEETRHQNVYRHRPVQRKSAIIYNGGRY